MQKSKFATYSRLHREFHITRTSNHQIRNGIQGYGYEWSKEEAMKNVLRTHTTAVSAKMLYKLAQQKEFKPTKYFRFPPFCGNFINFS